MKCPKCSEELKPIVYEGMKILECEKCAGHWLGGQELQGIVQAREVVFSSQEIEEAEKHKKINITSIKQEKPLICPECNVEMEKFNYAYNTGVIIDRCPKCSGVWLDKGELENIQIIIEEEEKRTPEIIKKLEPVLEKIKSRSQEAALQAEDSPSRLAKIPLMRNLARFVARHMV